MAWFKRNLIVLVFILLAVCSVSVLAAETLNNTGVLAQLLYGNTPTPEPAAATSEPTETPTEAPTASPPSEATGAGFQNRATSSDEPVEAWEQGGNLCSYDFALALDPDKKQMRGTLDFTYVNTESAPLSELHFLLYANSYEKEQYGIFEEDEMGEAYPNGFSPGSISIDSVTCADGKTAYLIDGDQKQVLRVSLPRAVEVGGTTKLTIEYTVTIPNCFGRFGYGDDTMSLVNCNPILSEYADGKWFDYPYYAVGDPFYSATSNYEATITAPGDWTIAATGVLTQREQGRDRVWTVDAPGRRDFGFVASDDFEVMQTTVDGVLVRSYYLKGGKAGGADALDTGAEAIGFYGKAFGQYPYSEFSVVQTDFFIGGMEYPGMVLIDDTLYGSASTIDKILLDIVVAHETGHQWWYSTIGDNEVLEPWLDEGLAEFTTQYFFEENRNRTYNDYYDQYNLYYKSLRSEKENTYSSTLPVFRFEDNLTYSAWVYDRTAEVLQDLRKKIGDEKFFSALRQYYEDNRLEITTRNDLEKAFEDASGTELSQWFEQEFNSSGN